VNDGSRSAPARRGGICEAEIEGELVLLDTSSGDMHLLNRVAAAIWSELDGARTLDEIVAQLSDAAGADAEQVHRDVSALVDELRRCDLLA
jgi:PqqD family protein of HPr-rel-A system